MWRKVSVLNGILGAARYCATGTIWNDRSSLQIQLGVWGRFEPPVGPGQHPGRGGAQGPEPPEALKILHFTVPKMGLKLMHFARVL